MSFALLNLRTTVRAGCALGCCPAAAAGRNTLGKWCVPMIIKQGEFVSFAPAELRARRALPLPPRPRKAAAPAQPQTEISASRNDLLEEVERLVRANERLTLERDQLREELSRQSLAARQSKRATAAKPKHVNENLRHQELEPEASNRAHTVSKSSLSDVPDDPGFELARIVVNWFWDDADEASVRLVHDALTGQGIRTLVRDGEAE